MLLLGSKTMRKQERNQIYSTDVALLAEYMETDPDPFFNGVHNWYYTGGNIITIKSNDNHLALHTVGKEQDSINITPLDTCTENKVLNNSILLDDGGVIFEIIESDSNGIVKISARQKFTITIFSLRRQKFKKNLILSANDSSDGKKIPFITGDFNKGGSKYYTMDLNNKLKMIDLKNKTTIIDIALDVATKSHVYATNWAQLRVIDENNFIVVDKSNIRICDAREPTIVVNQYSKINSFGHLIDSCEDITCLAKSKWNDFCYVGTSHKLFALDLRNIKREANHENDIVLRWTHQMENAPSIIKTAFTPKNEEIIIISSNIVGDTRLLNTSTVIKNHVGELKSKYLPQRLYSIQESLEIANETGYCLKTECNFEQRFKLSTTGIALSINDKKTISFLSQNVLGDVFKQEIKERIIKSESSRNEIAAEFAKWGKIVEDTTPSFAVTDIFSLNGIQNVLRCKKMKYSPTIDMLGELKKEVVRKPKWQQSFKQLSEYKDALASTLLSVWDIKPEVKDTERIEKSFLLPPDAIDTGDDRIMVWLANDTANTSSTTLLDTSVIDSQNDADPNISLTEIPFSQHQNVQKKRRVEGKKKQMGF